MSGQVHMNMHKLPLWDGDQLECGGNMLQDLGSGSLLATPTTCGHIANIADHPWATQTWHPPCRPDPWAGDRVNWPEKRQPAQIMHQRSYGCTGFVTLNGWTLWEWLDNICHISEQVNWSCASFA